MLLLKLKVAMTLVVLKCNISSSKRIAGTCNNSSHAHVECYRRWDCPGYCDENSTNRGNACNKHNECKKGKCNQKNNECLFPTGFCENDKQKSCKVNKDCGVCSNKSKNAGSYCKKHKHCDGGKCRPWAQKCVLPTGFCEGDNSTSCTSKHDCAGSCSIESKNPGSSCSKNWQCWGNKLCTFQRCIIETSVTANINRIYDPITDYYTLSTLINPERGFYIQHTYYSSAPELLSSQMLQDIKDQHLTLVLRLYYLDAYVESPKLSNVFLTHLQNDLRTIRLNGLKAIIRFAYSNSQYAESLDANKTTILDHISQIAPILTLEEDVIMIAQAGFIGAWGEWAYSDYFGHPDRNEEPNWDARKQIVKALVDNLPSRIIIQLRTPNIKMNIVNSSQPLNETLTHNDGSSLLARTGHHNDCFLASSTDTGTYLDKTLEYPYLETDTRYTAMGGETCNYNPPRSNCQTALEELKMFSWTYLNSEYEPNVLASWENNDGDCMNEIHSKLGYQLELKQANFSKYLLTKNTSIDGNDGSAITTRYFSFQLKILNNGFAAPINPHHVQIVLRNVNTGRLCAANAPSLSVNVRNWFSDNVNYLSGNVYLPVKFSLGIYEVLLHITDQSTSLRNKIDFKIKVANDLLNEAGTGLIKLLHTYNLQENITQEYTGGDDDWAVLCGQDVVNEIIPHPIVNPLGSTYLVNGGFEDSTIDADWKQYSNGYEVSDIESHTGLRSVSVRDGGAKQVVTLNANAESIIKISGYSKLIGVSNNLGSDYSIYADVQLDSGYLWGQVATFEDGASSNWTYSEFSFTLEEHAKEIVIYALYRNDPANGIAYFDDVQVTVDGSAPVVCPTGYYEPQLSLGECHWCPMGHACDGAKIACPDEYFATGGADSCKSCPDCNGHGVCSAVSGVCVCDSGWVGAHCDYAEFV